MTSSTLIIHAKGAPGLRLFGLGPNFLPCKGIQSLRKLMNTYAFWSKDRSLNQIKKLLANSNVIVSVWSKGEIIGFGRATSDCVFRAVLWDIIVVDRLQGKGIGRIIVDALLNSKPIAKVEKVYLMTTNSSEFYSQFGFEIPSRQSLLLKQKKV
jgi:N-acetylglutamate synthase-like GNAT family acetyltransferase